MNYESGSNDEFKMVAMSGQKKPFAKGRLITRKSFGAFDSETWFAEGDRLLATGRLNRKLFRRRRKSFSHELRKPGIRRADLSSHWVELEGTARASWLLVGYAVEMYLKAALAMAYVGCAESMFKRDLKERYSHELDKIAEEVGFPFESDDETYLKELKETLLAGRYPHFANDAKDYANKINTQTHKQWNESEFSLIVALAKRVRTHAARIDSDSKNPAIKYGLRIDDDGYLAFRTGGHMPNRITYQVSSIQKRNGEASLQDVIDLVQREAPKNIINHYWAYTEIFEDGEDGKGQKKTIKHPSISNERTLLENTQDPKA